MNSQWNNSLFCEGNVLLTRNGGIEGSLFGVRNVSMETSVKVIFYLPGMVASRDFLGSTFLGIKTLCNQLEFWMLTTTVTNMINGSNRCLCGFSHLIIFSKHFCFFSLFLWNNIDMNQLFQFNCYCMALLTSFFHVTYPGYEVHLFWLDENVAV